jgi:hypothetical protein
MAEWPNGEMAEWQNGGMMELRNGGMAEWWNGRMAEWHNVWYEIVRNQDTESTQMPPWQSPSWLVTKLMIKRCLLSLPTYLPTYLPTICMYVST